MNDRICFLSAVELARRMRRGELSPVEVVDRHLSRIKEHDDRINAFRTVFFDRARGRAQELVSTTRRGERPGPLYGVPVAVKDNTNVMGESTVAGLQPLLERDRPVLRDDTVVKRLRDAGAVIIGKTHMPELGLGTTDTSWGAPTSTPFDTGYNAGGSSGGSAAAVAGGMAALGLGTDGGGSIRIPASCCGVYGIKPTFRRVPIATTRGANGFTFLKPFSEYGPLARSVEDAAVMLRVMTGPHPEDLFALPDDGVEYESALRRRTSDLNVAYSPSLDVFPVSPEVRQTVEHAVERFGTVVDSITETAVGIDRSHVDLCDAWLNWIHVFRATDAELLKREGLDIQNDHSDDVHPYLLRSIERGKEISATDYVLSDVLRTSIAESFRSTFEQYDLVLAPTLAVPPVQNHTPYTVGPTEVAGTPVNKHIGWCLTYPINFSGQPAASLPAGLTEEGLPVGIQIIGPRLEEDLVLAASAAFERVNPWKETYPPL